jgi:hypothetical protein
MGLAAKQAFANRAKVMASTKVSINAVLALKPLACDL